MNPHDLPQELLPWSPEAEAGVIGCILLDNNAFDNVADILTAESFHDERIGCAFSAIASLVNACKPADVISVYERLKDTGLLGTITLADINAWGQAASSPRHARHYAEIVAEKSMARRLMAAASDVNIIAADLLVPVQERIGQAQAKIESLQEKSQKSKPQPIQNYIAGVIDHLQDLADGKVEPGKPTHIPELDRITGGLRGGQQIILAARPSIGKSSLAEQICINFGNDGRPSAMFSMEMSPQDMTARAICNIGRVDMTRFKTGKLLDEEWQRVTEAIEQMRNLPMHFDSQPAMTLQDVASKARVLKRKAGIELLVIDYIQLMGTTNPKASRHHQLEEISRGLKGLSMALDIPIITLSQLNREVEKRTGGRPMLADLKESGAIEEDADIVALMWKHMDADGYSINGLDVAKNRAGPKSAFSLHFEGRYQRWAESTVSLAQPQGRSNRHTEEF